MFYICNSLCILVSITISISHYARIVKQ